MSSSKSFDDAIKGGLARANKTLRNISGAWIQDHELVLAGGKITEYRVRRDSRSCSTTEPRAVRDDCRW